MTPLSWIVATTLLGGVLSVLAASLFALYAKATQIPVLISYAVGALLGAVFIEVLPHAFELASSAQSMAATILGGILLFFVLEKLVLWRHCHTDDCHVHGAAASLVLIGDAFHNFVDGAMIGSAVLTSLPLGVSTALAVAAHEVPQEVGDFAVLLHAGYSRQRALLLNVLSGVSGIAGALLAVLIVHAAPMAKPYLLCIAAASFLYVAMADLIPDLHSGRIEGGAFRQLALVALGIATAMFVL